ncbi:hypothetical protein NUW54_g4938 [Trametes sanguinea]|uniref:Uncharacterized protein n=1 Tax=Trametes sanguinea TaxID=158606 RepID=A0ACC1Q007_9APHY|nr:hypothetical protein NUW54_g4938 [Trametes sanguinea]
MRKISDAETLVKNESEARRGRRISSSTTSSSTPFGELCSSSALSPSSDAQVSLSVAQNGHASFTTSRPKPGQASAIRASALPALKEMAVHGDRERICDSRAHGKQPPPPPPPRASLWKRFLQVTGGITLVTLASGGALYYVAQKDRTPGPQLPHDPTKKTLVVLGSGWGATSLLNSLDTVDYNVIVISPKNYFLFTPLLPSVAVGTLSPRSILQPTRYVTRHKKRQVTVIEASATDVDPFTKTVTFADTSEIQGLVSTTTIPYDYLVFAVGAEVQTFNIPGVREHACFMKELEDAEKMQRRFLDCLESAAFPGQTVDEVKRLLHMVVVGGGPTGVELRWVNTFLRPPIR